MQNPHPCSQKSVCDTHFRPLGEIGVPVYLQLSSRTQFSKLRKEVNAKNHYENIKYRVKCAYACNTIIKLNLK